jgi:predicted acyl esterase
MEVGLCGCLMLRAQTVSGYTAVEARGVPVPMRDGVKLAIHLYRPARNGVVIDGNFPVILTRTPYDKDIGDPAMYKYFVAHG